MYIINSVHSQTVVVFNRTRLYMRAGVQQTFRATTERFGGHIHKR